MIETILSTQLYNGDENELRGPKLDGVDIRVQRWNQNNQNGKYAIPYSKRRLPLVDYLFYISKTYDKLRAYKIYFLFVDLCIAYVT